jgi:large subunit ribosomal protein L5
MSSEPRLKIKYKEEILPQMKKSFGYHNEMETPKLDKIVVNVGLSKGLQDPKFLDIAEGTLKKITGQKPVKTLAKKSISNFKIRKGMPVGMVATLRGNKMYDFFDKFINITLPRVRDFRGISPKLMDQNGNISMGFRESISFPEVKSEEIEKNHGLQITIKTTARNKEEGMALLKFFGFPFQQTNQK